MQQIFAFEKMEPVNDIFAWKLNHSSISKVVGHKNHLDTTGDPKYCCNMMYIHLSLWLNTNYLSSTTNSWNAFPEIFYSGEQ